MRTADSTKRRGQLVAELERRKLIQSQPVRDAFLAVPRELFVPDFAAREGLTAVYRDEAILTKSNELGLPLSSSSQPAIMALMLEQLELDEGMRVLEVGAGTGYNAALLSLLVGRRGRVVSVDVDRQITTEARRSLRDGGYKARVVHADGRAGFAQSAPYDRIIVTASADALPRAWFEQLAENGLLEVPLRLNTTGAQAIPVLRKTPLGFRSLRVLRGGFMPLRGADEEGSGVPPREACLNVTYLGRDRDEREPLLHLTGAALATLSRAAKRRLLGTALGEPRRQRLGLRADRGALSLYLSLTLPRSRLVSSFPGIGVISRDGASLALIDVARPDQSKIDFLRAYGGTEAEEFLLERLGEWDRRGRPAEPDIKITVTYEEDQARLAVRWPAVSDESR